jgi:ureidoacrylate peracid hydrolase
MTDRRRVALVVVDVQNDYCHPDGAFHRAGLRIDDRETLVTNINWLVAAARDIDAPVIWVRMVWDSTAALGLLAERSPFLRDEGLRRGAWGAEPLAGLDARPEDWVVEKQRFSAFYDTDLEDRLREGGIERLVVTGVSTDFCVESTVRDAFFRDLDVVVVRDAVAGYRPTLHQGSLDVMDTVFAHVASLDEAIRWLAPEEPAAVKGS